MIRSPLRLPTAIAPLLVGFSTLVSSPAEARRWLGLEFPIIQSGDGSSMNTVETADLNEDGKPDLIFANGSSLSVALGYDRDFNVPPFEDPTVYPSASALRAIITADFNEDGILDVATAIPLAALVRVYPGNGSAGVGDGTLGAPVEFSAGTNPFALASGDFNSDSILDLVVVNSSADTVSVLLGNGSAGVGNGTFAASTPYATGEDPRSVAVGDFSGDGIQDLVVASANTDNFQVLMGNGDGTFATAVSHAAGDAPNKIIVADFNEDSKLDVALSNGFSNNISVRLGAGDGTFAANTFYAAASGCADIEVADFNEDGILDLVTTNGSDRSFSVFLGNGSLGVGNGTFAAQVKYTGATEARDLFLIDFNRDGIMDLGSKYSSSGRLVLFPGQGTGAVGDGTFKVLPTLPAGDYAVQVADFNEDGIFDVVSTSGGVTVQLGNGTAGTWDGTFAAATAYSMGTSLFHVQVADFNEDGISDLATANSGGSNVSIRLGNGSAGVGNGTFGSVANYAVGAARSLAVADFNGDSNLDLATANSTDNNVGVLVGVGTGVFFGSFSFSTGAFASAVVAADFNGDGQSDLAVADRNDDTVSILLGFGDGTFAPRVPYAAPNNVTYLLSADFNEDGKADLVTVGSSQAGIHLGNGDGTFAASVNYPASNSQPCVADLNDDGILDIFLPGSNETYTLMGNGSMGVGDGSFTSGPQYLSLRDSFGADIADLNDDGREDFVVSAQTAGLLTIHLGKGVADELIAPRSIPFGTFELGSAPASLTVPLESDSLPSITLSASLTASAGGAFALTGLPASTLATNGATTNLTVSFAPTALGNYTGSVTVASSADNGNRVITLTGKAVDTLAPSSAATGPNGTLTQPSPVFNVSFSAADTTGGSGLATAELFYRRNGGSFVSYGTFSSSPVPFDTSTTGGDGLYDFYTVARDVATNVETKIPAAEASVTFALGSAVRDWSSLSD